MAIGARVGGAYVNVSARGDMASFNRVGNNIHRQLSAIGKKNQALYQRLGSDAVSAWRSALGAITASAPLIGSAVSALGGGATMLAGAFSFAAQSMGALYPLVVSLGVAGGTAAIGMRGFGDAVKETDPKKLQEALEKLTPSARQSALAVRSLSDNMNRLRKSVQERMFKGLSGDIEKLGTTLFPVLERGLTRMAGPINDLAKSLLNYANSKSGLEQINGVLNGSVSIFGKFQKSVVPMLDGLLRLFNALTPAGERLADRITGVAESFQSWTSAAGFADRVDKSMREAEKTAGLLFSVIGNLGDAIGNVFKAAQPATDAFLKTLEDVTQKFEDWSGSAEGSDKIAEWASNSARVLEQLGRTVSSVFELLAELADPRTIESFLRTLENAADTLRKLPLDKMVSKFADLTEAFEPISGKILAIVVSGAALNMLFGNLIGQVGGAVAAFGKLAGGIGPVIRDVSKLRGLLVAGLRFAGFAGVLIWMGSLIAKSDELKDKLTTAFEAVKEVGESTAEAFRKISGAIDPVVESSGPLLEIIDKLASSAVGVLLDMWADGLNGLATAIDGASTIIAGAIKTITGLFEGLTGGGFDGFIEGLKQMASGIGPLLSGLKDMFLNFFAPGQLWNLGWKAIGGLRDGLDSAFPLVVSAVNFGVTTALSALTSLPGTLTRLGKRAITRLGDSFETGMPRLAQFASQIVTDVTDALAGLPGQLFTLGTQAITWLITGFKTGVTLLVSSARQIVTDVALALAGFPVQQFTLGMQAITWLIAGFQTGIPLLASSARQIVTDVINALAGLPSQLFTLGMEALTWLDSGFRTGISLITSSARQIVTDVINALAGLPSQLFTLGMEALTWLSTGFQTGIPLITSSASQIVTDVINALSGLPGQLFTLGMEALTWLETGIVTGIPQVAATAGQIATDVINALADLPGRLFTLGMEALTWLETGIVTGIPLVAATVSQLATDIIEAIAGLPGKLFNLGKGSTDGLDKGIQEGTPPVISSTERIAARILNALAALPGQLAALGLLAVSRLAGAVVTGVSTLSTIAVRIVAAIVVAFAPLPGRLAATGASAIARLSAALLVGVSTIPGIAIRIVASVVSAFSGLPGQLFSAGAAAVGQLALGILSGIGSVTRAASSVAAAAARFFPGSPVKEGPLRAWNQGGAGRRLMGMLSEGVLGSAGDVERAAAEVSRRLNQAVSPLSSSFSISGSAGYATGATAAGATASGSSGAGNVTVNMTVSVDELKKLSTLSDFLTMLEDSRVNSRRTLRSGTVSN